MNNKKIIGIFSLFLILAMSLVAAQEQTCNDYCVDEDYEYGSCEDAGTPQTPSDVPEFNPTALVILILASVGLFLFVRNPNQTKTFAKKYKVQMSLGLLVIIGGTYLASNASVTPTGLAVQDPTGTNVGQFDCGQGKACFCYECPDNMEWNGTKCVNETKGPGEYCEEDWQCIDGLICNGSNECECPEGKIWNGSECIVEPGDYGEDCERDSECEPNLICVNREECGCPLHQYWNGSWCLDRGEPGDECDNDEMCLNNQICDDGNCTCPDDLPDWIDNICVTGEPCSEGETLCGDGETCAESPEACDEEPTNCGDPEICEGEDGCHCKECDGYQDHCDEGYICDYDRQECVNPIDDEDGGCPPGMNYCVHTQECYNPLIDRCILFDPDNDCGDENSCEPGDSCSCEECQGEQDTCDSGAVCNTNPEDESEEMCVCPYPTTRCLDGTCSTECKVDDEDFDCSDLTCQDGAICIDGECACPSGQTWNSATDKCETPSTPTGGGGGSSGGSSCKPNWECTEWSDCGYFSGTRTRTCTDTRDCNKLIDKPAEQENCRGIPACDDGLKNNGEEGIDCGGSCKPCPTEPTCNDGVQNQGEDGVDCGGPCSTPCVQEPTTVQEEPAIEEEQNWLWLWLLLLLLLAALLIGGFIAAKRGHHAAPIKPTPAAPIVPPKPKVAPAPVTPTPEPPVIVPPMATAAQAPASVTTLDEAIAAAKGDMGTAGYDAAMHADRIKELFKKLPVQEKTARFEEVMQTLELIKKKVQ